MMRNSNWSRGEVIGRGSYGVVSLAFRNDYEIETETETVFAVKSASKCCVSSLEALENEIDVLQSLSSPFIVSYLGDGETASCKELYMEYLPGGDVAGRGKKVADVDLIRAYTWCLVSALREVHANGIVHCDVKGGNVLVVGSGEDRVAKLADFGSAKRVGGSDEVVPRGSPMWMAPEVVRGESQGWESDVWALGCTVIEMFTGLPAWQDDGPHRTLRRIGYSDELPEVPARVSELGRDFLGRCLVRDPGQRWSCDQLLGHPFLADARAGAVSKISPRSVFGFFGVSEGEVQEEEEEVRVSGRSRIGELGGGGVVWESDGWVEVRNVGSDMSGLEIGSRLLGVNSEITKSGGCGFGGDYVEEDYSTSKLKTEIADFEDDYLTVRKIDDVNDNYPTWIELNTEIDDVEEDYPTWIKLKLSINDVEEDYSSWINLHTKIDEVEIRDTDESGRYGCHNGWLCRQRMRTKDDLKVATNKVFVLLILFLRLYCSGNVGNLFSFDKINTNIFTSNLFLLSNPRYKFPQPNFILNKIQILGTPSQNNTISHISRLLIITNTPRFRCRFFTNHI